VPEPGLVLGIWIFSGLLVLAGALALAELGAMLPHSGGLYVYMREAYGPFFAFLYGWTVMLVVIPGSVAALTTAFLLYLGHFVPMTTWVSKAVGITVLLFLAHVNARGVRAGANVQNAFTFLKTASLVGLVAVALVTRRGSAENLLPLWPQTFDMDVAGAIGLAMISTLFAYDGWHFVGFVAGEIREPARNVPSSILIGVSVVVIVYLGANLAYIFALGQPAIAASDRVASDAVSAMIGSTGASLIALAILCSTFGAIAANVLAGPRVLFAMARDGQAFSSLADVHPRYQSPANAIWLLAVWAAVLTLTGGYEHLITMSMFANWILFTMVAFSVVVLRRLHPEWSRPYRVPLYPFPVLIFVVVSSVFVVNTIVESTRSSLYGLVIVGAGVLFYFLRNRSDLS
ncbi:MAG TPA: amino acid permease, partial [Vicinamibacteria bacterium]|nr:amino acid permease [Vicinamibacteria bacterium]